MGDYVVTVDYQTTAGNPASRRVRIKGADDAHAAIDMASAKAMRWKRCLKVNGGDAEEVR